MKTKKLKENLEGQTPLEDESELLIQGTGSREELIAVEFENMNQAVKIYLVEQPSTRLAPFTYEWFLQVHQEMLGEVWGWAGRIRKTNKSIGVDKSRIREELKKLEGDVGFWDGSEIPILEVIARLHHRLVFIHPFEDGNGRWARFVTNIYLKQKSHPLIHWPEAHLVRSSDVRDQYLQALRKADQNDFEDLIGFHHKFVSDSSA